MLPNLLFAGLKLAMTLIHIHKFTFALLYFPDVVVVSDLSRNIGGSTDLAKKKNKDLGIFIPLFTPSNCVFSQCRLLSWDDKPVVTTAVNFDVFLLNLGSLLT